MKPDIQSSESEHIMSSRKSKATCAQFVENSLDVTQVPHDSPKRKHASIKISKQYCAIRVVALLTIFSISFAARGWNIFKEKTTR